MKKFAAVGEVLFDVFGDRALLGGAPANVCCMMRQFGLESFLVSAVGGDALGREARRQLTERGVRLPLLQVLSGHPTGKVQVSLDAAGLATYAFDPDSAYDHLNWQPAMAALAAELDAVVWGTLAQRRRPGTVLRFIRSVRPACLKVYDVNLRSPFYSRELVVDSVALADVVKMNEEEVPVLAGFFDVDERELMTRLFAAGVQYAAVTRGREGAEIFASDGRISRASAVPLARVVDTVGAGDAFTASLIAGLLAGRTLDEINVAANAIAAFVCGRPGATPQLPQSLWYSLSH